MGEYYTIGALAQRQVMPGVTTSRAGAAHARRLMQGYQRIGSVAASHARRLMNVYELLAHNGADHASAQWRRPRPAAHER
ncbi:MAG TPA: hypothetical protein VNL77_19235, partial [Roseiflexaceae bacterium]|nr:hypothetical protein [Roseiflexaceae bacterium]